MTETGISIYPLDMKTNKKKLVHLILSVVLSALFTNALAQQQRGAGAEPHMALRVRVNGTVVLGGADLKRMSFASDTTAMAAFRKNIIPIRRHASVQLKIELIDSQGKITDVTAAPSIEYQSLSPLRLVASPAGLVTVASSERPSRAGRSHGIGDLAVFISLNNQSHAGWNKVFFEIIP